MNMQAIGILIVTAVLPGMTAAGPLDALMDKARDTIENTVAGQLGTGAAPPGDGAAAGTTAGPVGATAPGGVQGAQVDGVRLGMRLADALQQLREHGFKMQRPSAASPKLGVTVKGRGPMPDGLASAQITLRAMKDIVYWINKTASYIPSRMARPMDMDELRERLRETYTTRFDTRYKQTMLNGELLHFDDTSPPPYSRRILSPHASVALNQKRGMLLFRVTMEWKDLVGAHW